MPSTWQANSRLNRHGYRSPLPPAGWRAAGGSQQALADTHEVTISKLAFTPAVVQARVGDTVVWRNQDVIDHTATVAGLWDVVIPAGKSARLVLDKPGDQTYYCRYHPNMTARLTVAAAP